MPSSRERKRAANSLLSSGTRFSIFVGLSCQKPSKRVSGALTVSVCARDRTTDTRAPSVGRRLVELQTVQLSVPFISQAQHRAWEMLAEDNYLVQCPAMRSSSAEIFEYRKTKLMMAFENIENVLEEGSHFGATRPSMVDAAWYPLLHRAAMVLYYTGFDFLSDFAKVKRWQLELMKIDALANAVPKDFERAFVDFYLNDQTYLGRLMTKYCAAWPPA